MDERSRRSSFPDPSNHPPNNINMNPNAQQQTNNNLGFSQPNNMLQYQPLQNLNNQGHNLESFLSPGPWRMPMGQPQGQQFLDTEQWWMPRIPGAAMPYPMPPPPQYPTETNNGIHIPVYQYYPPPPQYRIPPMFQDSASQNYLWYYNHHYWNGSSSLQYGEIPPPELPYDGQNQDHGHDQNQGGQLYSMNTVRGNVIMVAKEYGGSAFLLDTLMHGSPEDINDIFLEMTTDLCSLMMDRFGNLVVQKLIDVVDHNKLDEILDLLTTDNRLFSQVCTADYYGSRVVKKLVKRLKLMPGKQSSLASALSNSALSLTRSPYSGKVIYQCLKSFSPQFKQLLLTAIADYCLDIGQDKFGSIILKKCLDEAEDEIFNSLAPAIVQHADTLSEAFYGNYVVQHLIQKKKLEVNRNIVANLRGKFVRLSMSKEGSYVVEKLMKDSGLEEVADTVLTEILDSSSPLQVIRDRHGSFIVRVAIRVIEEGPLFDRLRKNIKDNKRRLWNSRHGKKVSQAMKERVKAMNERINQLGQ